MILEKEFNILKKPYLTPRIEFEEIEADEREMLLDGSYNTGSGGSPTTDPTTPVNPNNPFSLDLEFESTSSASNNTDDFLINDL